MFSKVFFDIYNATLSIISVIDVYGQAAIVNLASLTIDGHCEFSENLYFSSTFNLNAAPYNLNTIVNCAITCPWLFQCKSSHVGQNSTHRYASTWFI